MLSRGRFGKDLYVALHGQHAKEGIKADFYGGEGKKGQM